jgi:hypothetical protein
MAYQEPQNGMEAVEGVEATIRTQAISVEVMVVSVAVVIVDGMEIKVQANQVLTALAAAVDLHVLIAPEIKEQLVEQAAVV